jgi:hypothetical protein
MHRMHPRDCIYFRADRDLGPHCAKTHQRIRRASDCLTCKYYRRQFRAWSSGQTELEDYS